MITERPRSVVWVDKVALIAITVLATLLHNSGAPERAEAAGIVFVAIGVVLGLAITAIVLLRLFGKSLLFINSDRAAIVAVIGIVAVKIVIARVFLGA